MGLSDAEAPIRYQFLAFPKWIRKSMRSMEKDERLPRIWKFIGEVKPESFSIRPHEEQEDEDKRCAITGESIRMSQAYLVNVTGKDEQERGEITVSEWCSKFLQHWYHIINIDDTIFDHLEKYRKKKKLPIDEIVEAFVEHPHVKKTYIAYKKDLAYFYQLFSSELKQEFTDCYGEPWCGKEPESAKKATKGKKKQRPP